MVYKTKSCPYCGKPYSIMRPAKSGFYGSPFRRCCFCLKQFIDKDYREIAVSGIREVDTAKVSIGTALLGIFPVMLLAVGIWLLFALPGDTAALALTIGGALRLLLPGDSVGLKQKVMQARGVFSTMRQPVPKPVLQMLSESRKLTIGASFRKASMLWESRFAPKFDLLAGGTEKCWFSYRS